MVRNKLQTGGEARVHYQLIKMTHDWRGRCGDFGIKIESLKSRFSAYYRRATDKAVRTAKEEVVFVKSEQGWRILTL
jgi:hypothetical protein